MWARFSEYTDADGRYNYTSYNLDRLSRIGVAKQISGTDIGKYLVTLYFADSGSLALPSYDTLEEAEEFVSTIAPFHKFDLS